MDKMHEGMGGGRIFYTTKLEGVNIWHNDRGQSVEHKTFQDFA